MSVTHGTPLRVPAWICSLIKCKADANHSPSSSFDRLINKIGRDYGDYAWGKEQHEFSIPGPV